MKKITTDYHRGRRSTLKNAYFEGEHISPLSKMRNITRKDILQRILLKSTRTVKNHPPELIIGNISDDIKTRKRKTDFYDHVAFLAQEDSKNIKEAL